MSAAIPQPAAVINIACISDTANYVQITVALDCHGLVRMRCRALDDSGRECETELTRAEAHRLARALLDASRWPEIALDDNDCQQP
jgi:hypothetical protein